MSEFNEYAPGTFSWVDLATTDADAAKSFYTQLFGWTAEDYPTDETGVYTMMRIDGKDVAALYQMHEEQQAQGIPPHWLSYVTVADVNESAEKARSLGGQIIVEPMDVMEEGRMALVQDPTGATFALWQPKRHIGARVVNEPGTFTWNELATRDTETAEEFYTKLFGWESETQEMPMTVYTSFRNNGRMNAGMLEMTDEWGDIPPHWMVYFAVADCDASAEKAKSLGATVQVEPMDIPPVGRFAVIQDPQGAHFTIIKLNNPE